MGDSGPLPNMDWTRRALLGWLFVSKAEKNTFSTYIMDQVKTIQLY